MLCRRGGTDGRAIGALRVGPTYSIVEVAAPVAEDFEKATKDKDPRDPRVLIRRYNDGPPPGDRPPPPNRAPAPDRAPPPPADRTPPADRPSRRAVPQDRASRPRRVVVPAAPPSRTGDARPKRPAR
jgi:hypothetical protein